jgi:hypothetical protein
MDQQHWLLHSTAPLSYYYFMRKKLSLCLTNHHALKTYKGVEVWIHIFLTSTLHVVSGHVHTPGPLSPRKKLPAVIIGYEAAWTQSQPECDGEEKSSLSGMKLWSSTL